MDRIEDALKGACEDQKTALRKYHETGSGDDAACVHYEACLGCERALDRLIALRADRPALPAAIPGNRLAAVACLIALCIVGIGVVGSLGYVMIRPFFATVDASEIAYAERLVRYVRMPGRPGVCIAEYPGHRGFGPTFLGAARCTDVAERIENGEGADRGLHDYVIVRVRGTGTCLAHDTSFRNDFTFPCDLDD